MPITYNFGYFTWIFSDYKKIYNNLKEIYLLLLFIKMSKMALNFNNINNNY